MTYIDTDCTSESTQEREDFIFNLDWNEILKMQKPQGHTSFRFKPCFLIDLGFVLEGGGL